MHSSGYTDILHWGYFRKDTKCVGNSMPVPELPPTLFPNRSPTGDISCALEPPVSSCILHIMLKLHTHTRTLGSNRLSAVYFLLKEKKDLWELWDNYCRTLVEGRFWEVFSCLIQRIEIQPRLGKRVRNSSKAVDLARWLIYSIHCLYKRNLRNSGWLDWLDVFAVLWAL